MITITNILNTNDQVYLQDYILNISNNFTPDVSNYAKGRLRLWLNYEWDLKNKVFKEAYKDTYLWNICKNFYAECDLALITIGNIGINFHRDDSYAAFKAKTLNLGKATWYYQYNYGEYKWEKVYTGDQQIHEFNLTGGELITFNCKNPHKAVPLEENRISINMWAVSNRYSKDFNKIINT